MNEPKQIDQPFIGDTLPEGSKLSPTATKHARVRTQLIDLISDMAPGDRLPSERELAETFRVSRMTVRQAISSVADGGYVSRQQGTGTFVSDRTISKNSDLTGFSEDMSARGLRPSSRLLKIALGPAGADLGQDLSLSPHELVYHIERVRMGNRIPMCLETVDLPAHLVPGLDKMDLEGSLYEILSTRYGLEMVEASQVISATVVDRRQAGLLHVPVHSPALTVKRLSYSKQHQLLERAVSIYRADKYDVRLTVKRP
jgi:GntR family transcriptional regulator